MRGITRRTPQKVTDGVPPEFYTVPVLSAAVFGRSGFIGRFFRFFISTMVSLRSSGKTVTPGLYGILTEREALLYLRHPTGQGLCR